MRWACLQANLKVKEKNFSDKKTNVIRLTEINTSFPFLIMISFNKKFKVLSELATNHIKV